MGAMIGYDMPSIFASADVLGLDRDIVLALLPAAESGMREGIAKLREEEEEEQLQKKRRDGKEA